MRNWMLAFTLMVVMSQSVAAATLDEFKAELTKFNQETRTKMEALGEMLSTMSSDDLHKLVNTENKESGLTEAELLSIGSESVATGIEAFSLVAPAK